MYLKMSLETLRSI